MAKLTVFVAFLAALIALSTAATTTYTTTTTMVVTEINPQRSCQTEIQGMSMTHCKKYLATLSRSYNKPSFAVANPAGRYAEEHLEECCDEMRGVSSPCRGDAVRHVIKEMKEMWGEEEEEMQQMMMRKARTIPQKCHLRRSQPQV